MIHSREASVGRSTSHDLAIVVVNYRTPDLTLDCLRSVADGLSDLPVGCSAVVVENGSGDDSAAGLQEAIRSRGWSSWVTLVVSQKNLGFAGGNNLGLRHAPASRYVLLLNSDTILHDGCLNRCIEAMDRESDIGVLSCALLNRDGSPQTAVRRFPTPIRLVLMETGLPWRMPRLFEWADTEDGTWDRRTERRDVDWVGGAFMLIRREVLDAIGDLSESFFFYGEDIEFCHRAMRHGYRRVYDPKASITHLGGGSSGMDALPNRRKMLLAFKARYGVQRACYGCVAAGAVRLVDIAAWSLRYLWLGITGRRGNRFQLAGQTLSILCRPLGTEA